MGILDTDLTSVDISRPLLSKGAVRFVVSELKVEPSKDGSKENLTITLKTDQDHKDVKGNPIRPGFMLTHRISLTPTEKYPEDRIAAELKRFRLAVTGEDSGSFAPLDQYVGKNVDANVDVESDPDGKYPDQNRVRWILPSKK